MSYHERRALLSLLSNIGINAVYAALMLQQHPQGDAYSIEVFRFWGRFFLILIGVTIVAQIVIQIIFVIVNTIATREGEPSIIDERDRSIELRAARYSLYVVSIGFLLAMGSLVIDQPPVVMFLILLGAGTLSEVVFDASQFFFYRRGF